MDKKSCPWVHGLYDPNSALALASNSLKTWHFLRPVLCFTCLLSCVRACFLILSSPLANQWPVVFRTKWKASMPFESSLCSLGLSCAQPPLCSMSHFCSDCWHAWQTGFSQAATSSVQGGLWHILGGIPAPSTVPGTWQVLSEYLNKFSVESFLCDFL